MSSNVVNQAAMASRAHSSFDGPRRDARGAAALQAVSVRAPHAEHPHARADAYGGAVLGRHEAGALHQARNPLISMFRGVKGAFRDIKDGFSQHPIGTTAVLATISGVCWGLSKSPYPRLSWLVSGLTIGASLTQIGIGIHRVARDDEKGAQTDQGWERVGRGLAGLGLSATTAGAARMLAETPSLGAIQFLDDAPTLFVTAKNALKSPSDLSASSSPDASGPPETSEPFESAEQSETSPTPTKID